MKPITLATSSAFVLAFASLSSAQDGMTSAGLKDVPVTISGCVKAGTSTDPFVLFNVHNTAYSENPAACASPWNICTVSRE